MSILFFLTVGQSNASMADIVRYAIVVLPLVILHVAIPPLMFFAGERYDWKILTDLHLWMSQVGVDKHFLLDLTFDIRNNKWWHYSIVTHSLVHYDYNHALLNLLSLIYVGWDINCHASPTSFYILFFTGSIISILPLELFWNRGLQWIHINTPFPGKKTDMLSWFQKIPTLVSELKETAKSSFLKIFELNTRACGSSGAIAAFVGCGVAYRIVRIQGKLKQLYQNRSGRNRKRIDRDGIVVGRASEPWKESDTMIILSIIAELVEFYFISSFVVDEYMHLKTRSIWSQSIFRRLLGVSSDNINHQAHVQGFWFGFAVAVFWLLLYS